MTTIHFVSTEAGLRLLQATLRSYLTGVRLSTVFQGRIQHTSLGSSDPRDLAMQSGFLRLISVVEASVDSLGGELTSRSVSSLDEVLRLLVLEKELAATSTWDSRRRSFKRHHGVDLRKCAEHDRLEGGIEVRNAIAHGLGRLTTRQVLSAETLKQLARVNVTIVNGSVDLRPTHLTECANYCATFLRSLDHTLR